MGLFKKKEDENSKQGIPTQGNLSKIIRSVEEYNEIITVILKSTMYAKNLSTVDLISLRKKYLKWNDIITDIVLDIRDLEKIKVNTNKLSKISLFVTTYGNISDSLITIVDSFERKSKGRDLSGTIHKIGDFVDDSLEVFIGINKNLHKIISSAIWLSMIALIANQMKVWNSIRRAVRGYASVIKVISNELTFREVGQKLLANYTGVKTGKGAKVDRDVKIFVNLRKIFVQAIIAGRVAKLANQMRVWASLEAGIKGYKRALGALNGEADGKGVMGFLSGTEGGAEESIISVLKDKHFGINEIALLEFNTNLLKILPKTFFWAIVAGKVAKQANQMRVWASLEAGIKGYKKVMTLFNEELLVVAVITQTLKIDRVKTVKEDARIIRYLTIIFLELIVLSAIAKKINLNDLKNIAIGIGILAMISAATIVISFILKQGSAVIALLKLMIILPLLAIVLTEVIVVAGVAYIVSQLWMPLLIGLGVLAGVVLIIFGISKLIENSSIVISTIKLNLVIVLLAAVFTELIALASMIALSVLALVVVIAGLIILSIIVAQIALISLIIDKSSTVKSVFKINIVIALLAIVFAELIALSLTILLAIVAIPIIIVGLVILLAIVALISIIYVPKWTIKMLFRLEVALLEMIIISATLLLLDIVVSKISFGRLLLRILQMIGVITAIGFIFAVSILLLPILALASISVGIIFAIVGMVLLIAGILKILELIKLDRDKIKNNVKTVIECVEMVVGIAKGEKSQDLPQIDMSIWRVDKLLAIMIAIPVLATSTIVFTLIFIIALELKIIEKLDLNREDIQYNIDVVLDSIRLILDKLFAKENTVNPPDENDGWFKRIAKTRINQMGNMYNSVISMVTMFGSVPMLIAAIISVAIVWGIAKLLSKIQEYVGLIHENQIRESIEKVTKMVHLIKDSVTSHAGDKLVQELSDDGENKSYVQKALGWIGNRFGDIGEFMQSIASIGILATAIVSVGVVFGMTKMLNEIASFDIKEDEIKAKLNAIINCANHIKDVVFKKEEKPATAEQPKQEEGKLKKIWNTLKGGVVDAKDAVVGVVEGVADGVSSLGASAVLSTALLAVSELAEVTSLLNTINSFDISEEVIKGKVSGIIRLTEFVSKGVAFDVPYISELYVDVFGDYVNHINRFIDMIDDLNTEKSNDLHSIFVSLAGPFANVDIEKTAKFTGILIDFIEHIDRRTSIKSIKSYTSDLSGMIDTINSLESENVNSFIKLIQISSEDLSKFNENKSHSFNKMINWTVKDLDKTNVENVHKYTEDAIKLMNSVNKLDTTKVLTYTDMWAKMTEFMNEMKDLNISELADAIVNKIAPAMSDIADDVDKMSNRSQEEPTPVNAPTGTTGSNSKVDQILNILKNNNSSTPNEGQIQKLGGSMQIPNKSSNTDKLLQDIKDLLEDYFSMR